MIKVASMFFILVLISQGCKIQKNVFHKSFDINGVEDYIELKDTITLLVLGYSPAKECIDSAKWYSTCFGIDIKTDRVIKVISECNTDKTIKKGDFVKVIPQNKSEIDNKNIIVSTIMIKENRENKYSPLYKLQVSTTYSAIYKIE